MNKSENFGFNLPSSDDPELLADVNIVSENFVLLDKILKEQSENNVVSDDHFSNTSTNPVQNKVISNGVSNALRGTASGNPIILADTSSIPHDVKITLSEGGATVQKYGLNLWDEQYGHGVIATNGILSFNNTNIYSKNYIPVKAGNSIHFKIPQMIRLLIYDTNKTLVSYLYPNDGNVKTFTEDGYIRFAMGGYIGSSADVADYQNDICISISNPFTNGMYEPYKEPETLTADENGNIDGIAANGENMTFIADDGITISAEYNRDINKAFAELQNAIISLGGNV